MLQPENPTTQPPQHDQLHAPDQLSDNTPRVGALFVQTEISFDPQRCNLEQLKTSITQAIGVTAAAQNAELMSIGYTNVAAPPPTVVAEQLQDDHAQKRLAAVWEQIEGGLADSDLTEREKAVTRLLIKGASCGMVAEALGIAESTARNYASKIKQQVGATSRGGLALKLLGF